MFAPCEKVIIDRDNNPSLIAVIQGLTTPLQEGVEPPKGSVGLMRWDIFSLWQREDGDDDKEFIQECDLFGPDETPVIQTVMTFKFTASTHRNVVSVLGFPLAKAGNYSLRLWLRESKDDQSRRKDIAVFPLILTRANLAPGTSNTPPQRQS
jgi:hypothetical protein